jgi:hypothetical protein
MAVLAIVITPHSSVLLTSVIQAKSADDYDEPGRELASPICAVPMESLGVVAAKLIQNERVAIHHIVVIAAE